MSPDVPPPPPTPPGYVYAATDNGPRSQEERDLCNRARHPDWIYLGALALSDVASIYLDSQIFKASDNQGIRYLGPAFVGLTFGASIGGGYLALPKCSNTWTGGDPPEGHVRRDWPIAVALAAVSGAFAPMVFGTETGPWRQSWSVGERSGRIVVAGIGGVVGSLLPYLIPPKTWRAAKELENLRAGADQTGFTVNYTIRF